MTPTTSRPDLEQFMSKLQPQYESGGQADIGHMLDEYLIPFFYKGPLLICENGQRKIRRPDFTLPTYNNLVIESSDSDNQAADPKAFRAQDKVYRDNGIASLFLGPRDLAMPSWQQRLYERLEDIYHQHSSGPGPEYFLQRG